MKQFYWRSIRFRPRLLPTLAAVIAMLLTAHLGYWQQGRAAEKKILQASYEQHLKASPIHLDRAQDEVRRDLAMWRFHPAIARGVWQKEGQIFIDNKFHHERVGYHVMTPLRLLGSDTYLLVNRGWVPRTPHYPEPPEVNVPMGEVTVEGVVDIPSSHFLELSAQSVEGSVWQNLTIDRYQRKMKYDVQPYLVVASKVEPGLEPVLIQVDARIEKHIEYMLTWYSLSLTVFILWLALNLETAVDR
ncbi:MAG: SURF1 family protein [Betaproteobacteria bacterium]|nr:SURF1 family protein [Betaproteobacteria bacterium]